MEIATSEDFYRWVCGEVNSTNPFAYNYTAAHNYYLSYLYIFRKKRVQIFRELYNEYIRQGLLDPDHVMGEFSLIFVV